MSQTPLLIGAPAFAYIANNRDSDAIALGQTVGGLIFAGHAGMVAAQRTRIKGFDYPILFDPALYVQGSEKDSQKLDPVGDALSVQEELEVAAYITPAPMTPYRDVVGLRRIFQIGETFAARTQSDGRAIPTFTALVVTPYWLTDGLDDLLAMVGDHPNPLALIPASRNDLFTESEHVEGLLACLAESPLSFMLRCELSGIGLIAHGAQAVGIGTGSRTRHLYMGGRPKKPKGDREGVPPYVLVKDLFGFLRPDELYEHESDSALSCFCDAGCEGQSVARFADMGMLDAADLHTAAVWRSVLNELLLKEPTERPSTWSAMCEKAEDEFSAFLDRTGTHKTFRPPPFLRTWRATG